MIFVSVGAQLPFDRLIKTIDKWNHKSEEDIFAQIGNSTYQPFHIKYTKFLDNHAYNEVLENCTLIISHAGMGSIIAALSAKKPIIVFPRETSLGEVRSSHQLATIKTLKHLQGLYVAHNEDELVMWLNKRNDLTPGALGPAREEFLSELKSIMDKLIEAR